MVDYKNFLLQTEIAQRKAKSRLLIESTTSYYVMLGYRFGKVTPFYNYGLGRQDGEKDYAGVPTAGPLAGLGALAWRRRPRCTCATSTPTWPRRCSATRCRWRAAGPSACPPPCRTAGSWWG